MGRKFVDTTVYSARNMAIDGNIDRGYWLNKTNKERLAAATRMIEAAFGEPLFTQKKLDRTLFTIRKRNG